MKFDLKYKKVTYKDKNGNDKVGYNFYLATEDKKYIAIRPSFNNDFAILKYLAEEIGANE